MVKEGELTNLSDSTYVKWLLDAIHKVKQQKQRPNIERICNAVRQNRKVSRETIEEQLELAVKDGTVLKVYNKGLCSYKDPSCVSQLKSRTVKVTKKTDLTKLISKTIKELGEIGGSTLRSVEKYILKSCSLDIEDEVDLMQQLRLSLKKGISAGRFVKDGRHIKINYVNSSVESDSFGSTSSSASNNSALMGHYDTDMSFGQDVSFTYERNKVRTCIL